MYTAYVRSVIVSVTCSECLEVTQYASVQERCNQENIRTEKRWCNENNMTKLLNFDFKLWKGIKEWRLYWIVGVKDAQAYVQFSYLAAYAL